MRHAMRWTLVAAVAWMLGPICAAFGATVNAGSATWEGRYEADVMPSAASPAWTPVDNVQNISTVSNGVLTNPVRPNDCYEVGVVRDGGTDWA